VLLNLKIINVFIHDVVASVFLLQITSNQINMSKVIMFSRVYPTTHPRKGEPTYFVEKFWKGLQNIGFSEPVWFFSDFQGLGDVINGGIYNTVWAKKHTIRAGKRFKVGDVFSPRVWSGRPYCSKQITIAPDVKVVQTYDFARYDDGEMFLNQVKITPEKIEELATNDGLYVDDFQKWFNKPFEGQIICWVPVSY
jgi:hypothetical protein